MLERVTVVRLVLGLSGKRVRIQLDRANRLADAGKRALAFYLYDMQQRGLHQETGHQSAVQYAVDRLAMKRETARDLLAAGRLLAELALSDAAFCEGRIGWSKLRLLAKIATPETEREWIAKAEALTFEWLDRAIAGLSKGDRPREDKLGLPIPKFGVNLRVDAPTHAEWETVKEKLSQEAGEALTDVEAFQRLTGDFLAGRIAQDPGAPRTALVVSRCECCKDASLSSPDGQIPLDDLTAEMICCDSVNSKTPAWLRRQILARDGYRCFVCKRSTRVHVHHIDERGPGGRTEPKNLLTLCLDCHGLAHKGLLVIQGDAPHRLTITDKEGKPLTEEGARSFQETGVRVVMGARRGARAPEAVSKAPISKGLSEVVGQEHVVAQLKGLVAAAKRNDVPILDPLLLTGEAGHGKTLLTHAIAADLGTTARVIAAQHVKDASPIVAALESAKPGSVLFIDEIHKLPDDAEIALYGGLEQREITLIAATNLPEELSKALDSRFTSEVWLDEYSEEALSEIVKRTAERQGRPASEPEAYRRIARASRGTPREAVNLTRRVIALAIGTQRPALDTASVTELLALIGIDELGLDPADRKILATLKASKRPLGLSTLAAKTGIRKESLLARHEPYLQKLGLLEVTQLGRVAVGA